jgi:PilZ domain
MSELTLKRSGQETIDTSPDRRKEARYAADRDGAIFNGEFKLIGIVTIINMSLGGAKLKLQKLFGKSVPQTIFLVELGSEIVYHCEVRWQRDDNIGMRVVDVLFGTTRRRRFLQQLERAGLSTPDTAGGY